MHYVLYVFHQSWNELSDFMKADRFLYFPYSHGYYHQRKKNKRKRIMNWGQVTSFNRILSTCRK